MDYIIVELFGSNIDSLNERILTHLQMRKSSLRKIREVIREYAENLGICQNSVFLQKSVRSREIPMASSQKSSKGRRYNSESLSDKFCNVGVSTRNQVDRFMRRVTKFVRL